MKKIPLFIFLIFINCKDASTLKLLSNNLSPEEKVKDYSEINKQALTYCEANGFNEDYYFLVDLSIHSGKNRFFVYDFIAEKVTDKNLVTHGSCDKFEDNDTKWEKVKFSNQKDSHCSSKGKYKIGTRDYSSWGINVKYWLHGLESSNTSAVDRVVVLHSWDKVKNEEIYPEYSPLSWGCPAVLNEFMKLLDEKLRTAEKPILLWIVE